MTNTIFTKDFTKRGALEQLIEVVEGSGCANEDLLVAFLNHEIDKLDAAKLRARNKGNDGEPKDPLQSDYAVALRTAAVPYLTNDFQSLTQIKDKMDAAGAVAPSGKPFGLPWIGRILNGEVEKGKVAVGEMVVEKVSAKTGLKMQTLVKGYKLV